MTSKTNIIEIDGKKYEVKEVEAKNVIHAKTTEQQGFLKMLSKFSWSEHKPSCTIDFNLWIDKHFLIDAWENYLINQARIKGFISGCTIKTSNDMDIMKSGRMQLIGLSKLATEGRKSIVIYDNGRWTAEAIPEVKKQWLKSDTWSVGELLTREEMDKIKCELAKEEITNDCKRIIGNLTDQINDRIQSNVAIMPMHDAKLIREILNDYLK